MRVSGEHDIQVIKFATKVFREGFLVFVAVWNHERHAEINVVIDDDCWICSQYSLDDIEEKWVKLLKCKKEVIFVLKKMFKVLKSEKELITDKVLKKSSTR